MDFAWVQRDIVMLQSGGEELVVNVPTETTESRVTVVLPVTETKVISYRAGNSLSWLFALMTLGFFVWAVISGYWSVQRIKFLLLLDLPALRLWSEILLSCALPVFASTLGSVTLLIARNGEAPSISYSEEGITFDEQWTDSLLGIKFREWSDIHSLECTGLVSPRSIAEWKYFDGCSLIMDFKSGGSALLELDRLSRDEVEDLFLAVEKWSDQSVLSRRSLLLERGLAAVDNAISLSYTSIWTDALDGQFAATNFVPLRTASVLQSGRYEVRMQLASGGLSAVYLAKMVPNTRVVLKESVLPPDTDDRTRIKAKELFEREGRLLSRLEHPQIAKVLDFFVEDGRDYIALEYIPGVSLRQFIKSENYRDEQKIIGWAAQIADILVYLHELEPAIVHRDLTPDNLLARDDGNVALIDFGVSNEFISKATGTLVGKQAYISPEQFRGKAEPKSDIYSFGATLHFLLTGEDPEPLAVSRPKQVRPEVSAELDELVALCTDMDCAQRPDARAVLEACKRLVK
ncbi:MAG: hypothetical protein C0469_10200 [Cyanobacteria bacterium DS2.3.42]|nr:hypothetical protein [Cyanobacteria bacterium DS2.3.42]